MPISRRYHAFHPSELNREVDRKYAACEKERFEVHFQSVDRSIADR